MDWFANLPPLRPSRWKLGGYEEYDEARRACFAAARFADQVYGWYQDHIVSDGQEALLFQVGGMFDRLAAALSVEMSLLWESGAA